MYNTGQTAVFLKDLKGHEYPAIAEVNRKRRVNGQREISLSFLYTEINKDFMGQLEFGWKVLFDGEWYTITNPGYSTDGDFLSIGVTAILSFFVDLNGYYLQNKVENKSYTPGTFFNEVFASTPYSFVLVDAFAANTMTFEDNESKTARFLYGIDRFNAEFKVQGKVVYIHQLVGYDKDVILHEDLNVNSVRMEVDASGFHTWAKGFGDLPESNGEDEPEYQLEVEYRSPLIDKFGAIEGPAIKDGNYKLADSLTATVKEQVENSYTVSTEVDTVDLSNNGYPEMVFEEGDRIWLYVDRLNLNQQVRVMEVDETFDWEGNKVNASYVLGNEGIASRYKTQQYDSISNFRDIISGRKPLEYNWLPEAVKRASEIINGNQDSLFKYLAGEIIGINQSNPNGYMRFNTDGIGFSRDGGKTYQTAMTYEGIVADAITTGTLRAILIEGVEIYGSTIISESGGTRTEISGGDFHSSGKFSRTFGNKLAEYTAFIDSYDGALRARITEKKVNGVKVNTLERWLAFTDKTLTTQREVHSGSIDYKGARFIDFYADETLTGDVAGLGMHIYSGQNLTLESLYGMDIKTRDENYVTLTSAGLDIESDSGNSLAIRRKTPYTADSGTMFTFQSSDKTWQGAVGIPNDQRNMHLTSYFGDYVILRSRLETHIKDTDNNSYMPIRSSEYRNGSSITYKTNIEDLENMGLDIINKLQVKRYVLQSDIDSGIYDNWQVGVISELSPEIATPDGLAINMYKMLSYSVKAIQELSEKVDTQQQQLTDHELLIGELHTQVDTQQQQLTDFATLTESLTSRLAELEERVAQLEA